MTAIELNAMVEAMIWLGLDQETIAVFSMAALNVVVSA